MRHSIIIACLVFLASACKKPVLVDCPLPGTEMVRTQTQCADPWGYGNSNEQTIALLTAYLQQKNISTNGIKLERSGQEATCLACTCSRGFIFRAWAMGASIDSLVNHGFTVK